MGFCSCFGPSKEQKEKDRLASEQARAKAAEAAQKRQEQFENSAAGRAARVQVQAEKKQSNNPNKGEPVLKDIGTALITNWRHLLSLEQTRRCLEHMHYRTNDKYPSAQ